MAKNMQKPMDFVGENEAACFYVLIVLETDSGPILNRFWTPKSLQNRPRIGSERCPASCPFLNAIQDLQKSILSQHGPNMARFCPPRRPQVGAKMGSKSVPKRSWKRSRFRSRFWTDLGPILERFWLDFGTIFGPFWA